MTKAAIHAEYVDYRTVKTRKVLQIILEVPIEKARELHTKIGYPGIDENQIFCAIAKLNILTVDEPEAEPEKPKKSLSISQKCALTCNKELFWRFMEHKLGYSKRQVAFQIANSQECANILRTFLDIGSRSELDRDPLAAERWSILSAEYEHWKTA